MEGNNLSSLAFHIKISLLVEDICVIGGTHSAGLELALQGAEVMAWSFASAVPPPEADEGTGTSLQLNKTLQGVTFGEQQPKGTPGKGLGRLGSHTAPSPPVDWQLSTEGLGLGDVCGKPEPHRLPGNAARVT